MNSNPNKEGSREGSPKGVDDMVTVDSHLKPRLPVVKGPFASAVTGKIDLALHQLNKRRYTDEKASRTKPYRNGQAGPVRVSTTRRADHPDKLGVHPAAVGEGIRVRPTEAPRPEGKLIISSGEFVASHIPPEYVVEDMIQRRYLASFTGQTGTEKTSVILKFSAHVALGLPIQTVDGLREVEQGRVVYFAGENPDDIRSRWMGLSHEMGFDLRTIPVHFVDGADKDITENMERIEREVRALGGASLIVIDTSAAYLHCEDCSEDDNIDAKNHARMFRALTTLPGGPAVVVLAHPHKGAKADAKPEDLLPRGGGAFVNEVDSNLTLSLRHTTLDDAGRVIEKIISMHHHPQKHRGEPFRRVLFRLKGVAPPTLKTAKGKQMTTVVAEVLPLDEYAKYEKGAKAAPKVPLLLKKAREFLQGMLKEGPKPAADILVAANKESIPVRTLERAKKEMAVSVKTGDRWYWQLQEGQDGQDPRR